MIEEAYHRRVTKRDKCVFAGDILFDLKYAKRIKEWPGIKDLCLGNHDTESIHAREFCGLFDNVYALKKHKEFWISHAPIHPGSLRDKYNIHGHVHSNTVPDPRYINVSLEAIDYAPIALCEIRDIIKQRQQRGEYENTSI